MSVFDIFKKLDEEKAAKASQPIEWIVVGLGNPGAKYAADFYEPVRRGSS